MKSLEKIEGSKRIKKDYFLLSYNLSKILSVEDFHEKQRCVLNVNFQPPTPLNA
jgi:hypothetical protein